MDVFKHMKNKVRVARLRLRSKYAHYLLQLGPLGYLGDPFPFVKIPTQANPDV